jgi:RNA-directed DNA polymerase
MDNMHNTVNRRKHRQSRAAKAIVQQSIHQVLSRYYESYFSEHSYGFRPDRGAHGAIARSSEYVKMGYEWVVDIDLEKFFDKINDDRLMSRLKQGIGDKRLLRLINNYLKAGLMSDGLIGQRTAGTPQGGPLSPLLSNIVLDELDQELEKRGHKFCRYADDCNIYVKSEKAGHRVMESVIKFIEGKLKLRVNREKSGVRHCEKVKFLGFTVMKEGKIRVADKSHEKLKDKIRECCKRNRGVKFTQVIKELNQVIVGWASYFRKANTWIGEYRHVDSWVRRKLRCYRLKQSQRKYSIYKLLVSLGAKVRDSWNVVMYSQGWWAMSNKRTLKWVMPTKWFAEQSLRSIHAELTRPKY